MVPRGRQAVTRQRRRAGAVSRARIAASSAGSAWSQPQTWSVPWVTSRRSSSAGGPADVAGLAATAGRGLLDRALDGDDDVARGAGAGPAGGGNVGRRARRRPVLARDAAGTPPGGSSGNDSTSVGPSLPMCVALRPASSASSAEDQPDRGRRRRAGRVDERRGDGPGEAQPPTVGDRRRRGPSRSIRHGATVDRALASRGRSRAPPAGRRRAARATRARRPCSAGRRSACGTSRAAAATNASRIRSRSRSVRSHSSNWPSLDPLLDDPRDHRPDRRLVARRPATARTPRRRRRA